MSTIPTDPPLHEQVRATREHTTPFRRAFARRVRATLASARLSFHVWNSRVQAYTVPYPGHVAR
jgi:hypothetical protein